MNTRRKACFLRILSAFVLIAMMFAAAACGAQQTDDNAVTTVGSVNGTEITSEETDWYTSSLRSNVISYFIREYGAEYGENFWQTPYGDTTPEKYLFNEAFSKAADAKLKLLLCKEYGIYDDISFGALKAKAEKFNKDNEGKKTVGITSIDMNFFYDYYVSNGVLALQNILIEKGEIASGSDFEDWYAEKKSAAEIVKHQDGNV